MVFLAYISLVLNLFDYSTRIMVLSCRILRSTIKKPDQRLPWWSIASALPMQEAWVRFLVGELRSHIPVVKNKNKQHITIKCCLKKNETRHLVESVQF